MICQCPSCDQSYELADEQVTGKSVILSCPPCNTSWIVGPVAASSHPDQTDQMDSMGEVGDDDETGAHHRRGTFVPPPPSYSAPPASYSAPPAAMPQLFVQEPQKDVGTSGSPSARRILRGEAREQRDLFASRAPSDHGRQTPTPAPSRSITPPAPSSASASMFPGSGTAARGEHSLLFSVEELKKAATMRPPPPSPTAVFQNGQRVDTDEHGVIDLKPMLSAGGAVKSRTEPLYTPANEINPLGFALSVPPQQKTPVWVFAAAAAAAVLLLAVGLGVALRGGSSDSTAANADVRQPISQTTGVAAAAQPAADAPSSATISPAAKAALSDSKSDAKSDSADAVSPMKGQNVSNKGASASGAKVYSAASKGWKGGSAKVSSGGTTGKFTPKASAPPTPPKAKGSSGGKKGGSDPCGCGANLECAMRCGS